MTFANLLPKALLIATVLGVPGARAMPPSKKVPPERILSPLPGNADLLQSGIPAIPPELTQLVQRYGNSRSALLQGTSTDGQRLLIATRFGSTTQLHQVDRPLGERTQLTFGEEPIESAHALPQDDQILFYLQDEGGGELFQLYRLDRSTEKKELLTDGKTRQDGLLLSHEGQKLVWSNSSPDGKSRDLFLADIAAPAQAKRLTTPPGHWRALDFSPLAKQVLAVNERSLADVDLWLIDVASGVKKQLTPKDGKASVRAAAFSADGHAVYYVTDRYSNFNELVRIDLTGKAGEAPRRLTSSIPWDVEQIAVAHDTGAPVQVAIVVDQDGYDRVYLVEPGTGQLEPVALPTGVMSGLSFAERKNDLLSFSVSTAQSPADVFQLDVRTRKLTRWTQSELGPVEASTLTEPELVHYQSADGSSVPAFVYRPQSESTAKRPALIMLHGGPAGQARPSFDPFAQLLSIELGLTVIMPNPRGSDGYGKAWLAAGSGATNDQATLADIAATLDWAKQQSGIDPARIGLTGSADGGTLALAAAAAFPDRIKAVVDISNPSPNRDSAKISAALLIVEGKIDPRSAPDEAQQLVRDLRTRNHDAWLLLGINEASAFQKKQNRDSMNAAILLFLQKELIAPPQK